MKRFSISLLLILFLVAAMLPGTVLEAQDKGKKEKSDSRMTLYRNTPMLAIDSTKINKDMLTIETINMQAVSLIKSKNGKGPGPAPIPLKDLINWRGQEYFGIDAQSILSLSLTVYRDIEKNSFIFYYIPARYYIKWNPDEGYYMAISYARENADSSKNVLLQTRMTPGIRNQDFNLLKELIKIHLRNNGESSSRVVLQPLPANYVPSFNLPAIGEQDISVTGVNPDTRELGLSITTDEATKELLVDQLSNTLGLTGNIVLVPEKVSDDQPDLSSKPVDANMRFCDNNAYARKPWDGDLDDDVSTFLNDHPLPVKLKYLCYLYNRGNDVEVRGYDLGARTLLPGQRARIQNDVLNSEMTSSKSLAIWYEYTFDCDSDFLSEVVRGLTGGVGSVPTQELGVTMVQASETFDQYGIYLAVVTMRSRYFDPEGEEVITNTYELTADNADIQCAPLYLWDDEARGGDIPLYEFKLSLVMTTGDVYEDTQWRDPRGVSAAGKLFIGASLIEEKLAEQ